ncbi:MAG: hypothetical protein V7K40_15200 [Nostoc sp.]|uniref:hypothetical protein n=1 Tax=Nostoc sp. TaxID=1180 RepID=UPI002FF51C45
MFPRKYHQAYSLGKTRAIANVEQANAELYVADFVKQFGVIDCSSVRSHPHIIILGS